MPSARKACPIACSKKPERLKQQLADSDKTTLSKREAIERLKADLKSLEESQRRLTAGTPSPGKPGNRVKGFVGTGDRQYLSGLKLGGERILILVDVSASMLDETVVNVIRLRNMSEARRLMSEKWRRTVATDRLADVADSRPSRSSRCWRSTPRRGRWCRTARGKWLDGSDAQALNGRRAATAAHGARRRHEPRERFHGDERAEPGAGQRVHHHRRAADAGRIAARDPQDRSTATAG